MTLYTIHALSPEAGAVDPVSLAFVKDGFSWPAFFFGPLWLVFRRMWLVLAGWLVVAILLAGLRFALPGGTADTVGLLAMLLFAFEANDLRRWTLDRAGWRTLAVSEGRRRAEAERRFFSRPDVEGLIGPASVSPPPAPRSPAPSPPSLRDAGGVIGLFPTPGGAR